MKVIDIDQDRVIKLIDDGLNVKQIALTINVKYTTLRKRMKMWGLKSKAVFSHSPEQRKTLSILRKQWIKNNPERFHSMSKSRNKSVPCEKVKLWLKEQKIDFIEEYQPLLHKDRYFSIDIAFPDKMIGIEINGNQHYNPDGTLTKYYQDRHDLIESEGWTLYELHYSLCFKIKEISHLIPTILSSDVKVLFDYTGYVKKVKPPKVSEIDPMWRHRIKPHLRLKQRPSVKDLSKMVWDKPILQISKDLGCSDVVVAKWCKQDNITRPPQGYWRRRELGYTHEEALIGKVRNDKPLKKRGNPITDTMIENVITRIKQGETFISACQFLGFSHYSLRNAIKRKGLSQMVREIRFGSKMVDPPGVEPGTEDS